MVDVAIMFSIDHLQVLGESRVVVDDSRIFELRKFWVSMLYRKGEVFYWVDVQIKSMSGQSQTDIQFQLWFWCSQGGIGLRGVAGGDRRLNRLELEGGHQPLCWSCQQARYLMGRELAIWESTVRYQSGDDQWKQLRECPFHRMGRWRSDGLGLEQEQGACGGFGTLGPQEVRVDCFPIECGD